MGWRLRPLRVARSAAPAPGAPKPLRAWRRPARQSPSRRWLCQGYAGVRSQGLHTVYAQNCKRLACFVRCEACWVGPRFMALLARLPLPGWVARALDFGHDGAKPACVAFLAARVARWGWAVAPGGAFRSPRARSGISVRE